MDGLSVAASVAGLFQATTKVISFISAMTESSSTARNVLAEVKALQIIFSQLQNFIDNFTESTEGTDDRKSMISVNQLVATLTGCFCAFTDLEQVLESLNTNEDSSSLFRLWSSAKWALKDKDLSRILSFLQIHKSSLSLILQIIYCESSQRAERHVAKLEQNIEKLVTSDPNLSARMAAYEPQPDIKTARSSILSVPTIRSAVVSFESTLAQARVYQNAFANTSTRSFKTMATSESKWSQFTGLSLSEISNVSVICLPISARELCSSHLFDYKAKSGDKSTGLLNAAAKGHTATVRLLISGGANMDTQDSMQSTALHHAAANGHTDTVRLLVALLGANKEAKDINGWTALHKAACNGHHVTVQLLVELGVHKEARTNKHWTALHHAAFNGHNDTIRKLVELNAYEEAIESVGMVALHLAAIKGHITTLRLLVNEFGASIESKDDNQCTALHCAAGHGQTTTVRVFVEEFDANKEAKDIAGRTGLHYAAAEGHQATVELLLDLGITKQTKDKDGMTALHYAARNGHDVIVRLLIKLGANKEAKNTEGRTALHFAALYGHHASILQLIELGVGTEPTTIYGSTPLHFAACFGHNNIVRLLVESGVDREAAASNGRTALHSAAHNGHESTVRLLVSEFNVDKDAKDKRGRTALHHAVSRGHNTTAWMLMALGAYNEVTLAETGC